jgi:hypothetical protein
MTPLGTGAVGVVNHPQRTFVDKLLADVSELVSGGSCPHYDRESGEYWP